MPICVMCCSFGYGLGVGPVTFALLGEILPLKVKSVATSIVIFLKYIYIYFPYFSNQITFSPKHFLFFQICGNFFVCEIFSNNSRHYWTSLCLLDTQWNCNIYLYFGCIHNARNPRKNIDRNFRNVFKFRIISIFHLFINWQNTLFCSIKNNTGNILENLLSEQNGRHIVNDVV